MRRAKVRKSYSQPCFDEKNLEETLQLKHRVIPVTVIELQSLVVFGCTALHTMVGATARTHDWEEQWVNFLFV